MEIYQTEEQQVDAIKGYWKDNGKFIIAGLILGLGGFVGIQTYKENQKEQAILLSDQFLDTMETSTNDAVSFTEAGDKFIAENGSSSYATLTALSLAKEAASAKDWPKVESYLMTAVEKSTDEGIKAIATLRLARVQIQLESFDKALATLSAKLPASFTASAEEIKGDVYLQQGNKELARNAYQAALTASALAGNMNTNPVLQMKIDDLAVVANLSE